MRVNPHNLKLSRNIRELPEQLDTEDIDMLASMRSRMEQGLPPLSETPTVYHDGDEIYVKSGHRRVMLCCELGVTEIEVFEVDPPTSESGLIVDQFHDGMHRKDLPPLDRAKAILRLMQLEGLQQKGAAERLVISEPLVSQLLALLGLHPKLQQAIKDGKIHWKAAYEAKGLPRDLQEKYLDSIVGAGDATRLTVNGARKNIQRLIPNLLGIAELELERERREDEEIDEDEFEPPSTKADHEKEVRALQRLAIAQDQQAIAIAEEKQIKLTHRLVKVRNDLLAAIQELLDGKSPEEIVTAALQQLLKNLKEK